MWDLRGKSLFEQGKIFKEDLIEDDIKLKPQVDGLSRTERQWIQIEKERDKDTFHILIKRVLKHLKIGIILIILLILKHP